MTQQDQIFDLKKNNNNNNLWLVNDLTRDYFDCFLK